MRPDQLKDELIKHAREAGFASVRITRPGEIAESADKLDQFIAKGWHADMDWMAAHAERRRDPLVLWPDVRSIIMLAMNYGPEAEPLVALEQRSSGAVSCYAQGRDYHDVVKKKLKAVAGWLHRESQHEVKVFVDTAPVMEKPLAAAAGLGWQGKHTNLVSRQFGSWLFLGAIFTTAEVPADARETDHCGQCRACLDICPTDAFPAPYQLDARRCISYLTIEHKGHIAPSFRGAMGNRIYGCDDCLAVCPWNKFAQTASESRFHARDELRSPALGELARLDDKSFRALFSGSPIKRTGRDRFVRNVLIAIGNSAEPALLADVTPLLEEQSPLVRAMAVWALGRLGSKAVIEHNRRRFEHRETDPDVKQEWSLVANAAIAGAD